MAEESAWLYGWPRLRSARLYAAMDVRLNVDSREGSVSGSLGCVR